MERKIKKGVVFGLVFVLIAIVFVLAMAMNSTGDPYADVVVSYTPGDGVGGGNNNPEGALGAPEYSSTSGSGLFVSLGRGGSIILAFTDNVAVDGFGDDLMVVEVGMSELGQVYVSNDGGASFVLIGIADGQTSFDLSGTGLSFVNAVKIVDYSQMGTFPWSGFDVDAVVALNSVELLAEATIDIEPDTLNPKSRGKWITCCIELPEGYDVNDVDVSTVLLEGIIPAEPHPAEIGDNDEDGIPDLKVKFDRKTLIEYLGGTTGEVTLTVTGEVDEILFEGSDTIRVIN